MNNLRTIDTKMNQVYIKKSTTGYHDEIQFEKKFFTFIGIRGFEVVSGTVGKTLFSKGKPFYGLALNYELYTDIATNTSKIHEYVAWFDTEEESIAALHKYRLAYIRATDTLKKEFTNDASRPK